MPRVVTSTELGAPLGMYSHGMVAPGGEIVVVAGRDGKAAHGESDRDRDQHRGERAERDPRGAPDHAGGCRSAVAINAFTCASVGAWW